MAMNFVQSKTERFQKSLENIFNNINKKKEQERKYLMEMMKDRKARKQKLEDEQRKFKMDMAKKELDYHYKMREKEAEGKVELNPQTGEYMPKEKPSAEEKIMESYGVDKKALIPVSKERGGGFITGREPEGEFQEMPKSEVMKSMGYTPTRTTAQGLQYISPQSKKYYDERTKNDKAGIQMFQTDLLKDILKQGNYQGVSIDTPEKVNYIINKYLKNADLTNPEIQQLMTNYEKKPKKSLIGKFLGA